MVVAIECGAATVNGAESARAPAYAGAGDMFAAPLRGIDGMTRRAAPHRQRRGTSAEVEGAACLKSHH
jgi:hypothetical protein